MIKSYHEFYSKKLKHPEDETRNEEEDESREANENNHCKNAKIDSPESVSSLDETTTDSSSQSLSPASLQHPISSKSEFFSAAIPYTNFPYNPHIYNNSHQFNTEISCNFQHTNFASQGNNNIRNPNHSGSGHVYNPHYAYNPTAFNSFNQNNNLRVNINSTIKPNSRESTNSSIDSTTSNSLSSPSSIMDENSCSNGIPPNTNPVYYNTASLPQVQSQQSVSFIPPIIDPSSLLLRVNKPPGAEKSMPIKKRVTRPVPPEVKDPNYWEKRKKNNESAKRSRDMKRTKEEQISMRVIYLEQENLQLKTEVSLLRAETDKLRCMVYPMPHQQQQINTASVRHN